MPHNTHHMISDADLASIRKSKTHSEKFCNFLQDPCQEISASSICKIAGDRYRVIYTIDVFKDTYEVKHLYRHLTIADRQCESYPHERLAREVAYRFGFRQVTRSRLRESRLFNGSPVAHTVAFTYDPETCSVTIFERYTQPNLKLV